MWWLRRCRYYSLGFVKSTSSIGCVDAESNAPAGEPRRPRTSGIDYFGVEDGTSVESSNAQLAATLVPQALQVIAVVLPESPKKRSRSV